MTDFLKTRLPGVLVIEPRVFDDERGFFLETWHAARYAEHGIAATFVQDNHSKSQRGTLRGLHANTVAPQDKLVRCVEGEIYDAAVDIRRGSPTFGQWFGTVLSAANFKQIWVPAGFAHGFCVMSDVAQVEYKVTAPYTPEGDIYIKWNDPTIGIEWPLDAEPLLSARDAEARPLAEQPSLPAFAG